MSEWVKEHLEAVIGWGLILGGAGAGFVRGVFKTRSDHEQLRREFDAHMSDAKPLMASFIEVRERVETLDQRMEEKFGEIMQALREGREDVNRLNDTVVSLLQRGFGSIRGTDQK